MNYEFKTSKGIIKAYIPFRDYSNNVTIKEEEGEIESSLYNNSNGELCFKYNEEEILFKNFIKHSMKEISDRIEKGEDFTQSELMLAIICDGVYNVKIGVELCLPDTIIGDLAIAICGDKKKKCIGRLSRKETNLPHERYRLEFEADETSEGYGKTCSETKYVSQVVDELKTGKMKIFESIEDGKTADERIIEYFTNVTESNNLFEYKLNIH